MNAQLITTVVFAVPYAMMGALCVIVVVHGYITNVVSLQKNKSEDFNENKVMFISAAIVLPKTSLYVVFHQIS